MPVHTLPRRSTSCTLRAASAVTVAAAALLAGCVFSPRTVHVYDPECRVTNRQMVLEAQQMPVMARCRGDECAALLVVFGAVSAASMVISGSIVVVGNVTYWFEKQTNCKRADPAGLAASATR